MRRMRAVLALAISVSSWAVVVAPTAVVHADGVSALAMWSTSPGLNVAPSSAPLFNFSADGSFVSAVGPQGSTFTLWTANRVHFTQGSTITDTTDDPTDVTRAWFGIAANGDGGCHAGAGSTIHVDQVAYSGDTIDRLHLRMQILCSGGPNIPPNGNVLVATLAYNSTLPVYSRHLSASALDFGTWNTPSYVATRDVTVTNDGFAPLSTPTFAFSGAAAPFAIESTTCTAPLAPGATCTLRVGVHLTALGPFTARITVVDSANDWIGPLPALDLKVNGGPLPLPEGAGSTVHSITPVRLLDTREANGVPTTVPLGQTPIRVQIAGRGGVPADAVGVIANLTVTAPTRAGFVSIYPGGEGLPEVSNQNVLPGDTVANMSTLALGDDGTIEVFNSAGTAHVLIDVVAWLGDDLNSPPPQPADAPGLTFNADDFTGRLKDTRGCAKVAGGTSLHVNVWGFVPVDTKAVLVNITATEGTADTYLTAYNAERGRPLASMLNVKKGETRPNLVLVELDSAGGFDIYNDAGATHVIVDVVGRFGLWRSGNTGRILLLSPTRAFDTRPDTPIPGNDHGYVSFQNTFLGLAVRGVIMNATVTQPTAAGYLSVFKWLNPTMDQVPPTSSTLNFVKAQTVPNEAWVDGTYVGVANGSAKPVHLILDVQAIILG